MTKGFLCSGRKFIATWIFTVARCYLWDRRSTPSHQPGTEGWPANSSFRIFSVRKLTSLFSWLWDWLLVLLSRCGLRQYYMYNSERNTFGIMYNAKSTISHPRKTQMINNYWYQREADEHRASISRSGYPAKIPPPPFSSVWRCYRYIVIYTIAFVINWSGCEAQSRVDTGRLVRRT